MAYRLIIFDFDGTLADSAGWFARILNGVAARFRFRTVTEAEIEMLRSMESREIVRYFGVPSWKMPFIAAHVRKLAAAEAENIRLFEGVPNVIRQLACHGVAVAVVSSNSEANVRKVLGPELAGLVAHYGCGASVFGKAAKFRQVMRRAKVAHDEVLCVGDEVRDIEAAAKAGLASAAVTWGYAAPETLCACRPTVVFRAPAEIAGAVAA